MVELNSAMAVLYKKALKPIMFKFDPEKVHNAFITIGKTLGNYETSKKLISKLYDYKHPSLKQTILGLTFTNPIGLSAGFDKNAELIDIIPSVGFGFEEVGSMTANSCAGNPGVRLKRMPNQKSIWVNLGLNNKGIDELAPQIASKSPTIPILISIAKTNSAETVEPSKAVADYIYSLKKSEENNIGSAYVINISCPNAYGGQPFSDPKLFKMLMHQISLLGIKKPILIKISPDLDNNTIDKIVSISSKYQVAGFVCTNLTKKDGQEGGFSGGLVKSKSNELISYLYRKTKGKKLIIGVGGIFSAEDAYEKIKRGASLVSLITGMIYEGPTLISSINRQLVNLLKKDGYSNISEAIGISTGRG